VNLISSHLIVFVRTIFKGDTQLSKATRRFVVQEHSAMTSGWLAGVLTLHSKIQERSCADWLPLVSVEKRFEFSTKG
jgi:hypothetical protein